MKELRKKRRISPTNQTNMVQQDSVTLVLAAWGALLTTLTTFLSFLLYKKDRPLIRVTAKNGFVAFGPKLVAVAIFGIQNSGRRQITIKNIYLELPDGRSLFFKDPSVYVEGNKMPVKLEEGTSFDVSIYGSEIMTALQREKVFPRKVVFDDALGRSYKKRIKERYWKVIETSLKNT